MKRVVTVMSLLSLSLNSFADSVNDDDLVYLPETINYIYPIYQPPPPPKIYDPNAYKNYNYFSLLANGLHQYNNIPGYNNSSWINGGVGLEYGYMWNMKESNDFMGLSLGVNYFGESTHTLQDSKGQLKSYSMAVPFKGRYLHRFDKFSAGINGGAAYGFGINRTSGGAKAKWLYNNILPVAGADVTYDFSRTVHLVGEYSHYFGGWTKPIYTTAGGYPSVDSVSIGVRYAF